MKYFKLLFITILSSFGFGSISLENQSNSMQAITLEGSIHRNSSQELASKSRNKSLNSLNIVKFLKERADKDNLIENREILEGILKSENIPIKFIESCGEEFNLTYARIHAVYEVAQRTYVISFLCTSYIRSASFRLFLYNTANKSQLLPLELVELKEDSYGAYQEVTTSHVIGQITYEKFYKELSIASDINRCGGTGGRNCSNLAKYKFRNNEFVLTEFLIDNKDDGQTKYNTRFYP